ncbi:hypothetical protein RF679_13725 [Undibacterium cyanobacteriorum]|uniref:Uncharacterized protein n=1 Tax=Undibacterium cyanobacteriorum TaxID=3073561 RepID=A0ABY9RHE8_9BURK|nr:hypothetical protein [Undibacterium sp. 20NA77.5]WMW79705.1 hypothetical protein RF679_13725 [Undibacterium sp. 20NA77.5]
MSLDLDQSRLEIYPRLCKNEQLGKFVRFVCVHMLARACIDIYNDKNKWSN